MSYEQAVVNLQETNAELVKAVNRVRDAAMGMNRMYASASAGVAAVLDGEYFVVPGGGVYQRLYQRSAGSATLIAEYPDASEVVLQSEIGTAASRDVTSGFDPDTGFDNDFAIPSIRDTIFAVGVNQGDYQTGSSTNDLDRVAPGHAGLWSNQAPNGTFPVLAGNTFFWIRNQKTYTGGSSYQFAINYSANSAAPPNTFRRIRANTDDAQGNPVWGPWARDYNTHNILGTVSQSGGIPTGAIIERGSNANGEYTKFADGTLICLIHDFEPDWGSAYYQNLSLPHLFINGIVTGMVSLLASGTGGSVAALDVLADAVIDVTAIGACRLVFRGTKAPDLVGGTVNLCFLGRWY